MNKIILTVFFLTSVLVTCVYTQADSIPVANHSFESPVVPPESNPPAYPVVSDWIEMDNDEDFSANTGVFTNVTGIAYADANQLAFLGSEKGNALLQDLSVNYQIGKSYIMTVGICISAQYQPPDPNGLILSFYYKEVDDPNALDIISATTLPPSQFTADTLEDNSVYLPAVQTGDNWAGKNIGIAIRAAGSAGGFWDMDNVRVIEYPSVPDFTGDSVVNLEDFAMMAMDWLLCNESLTDVTGDGCVDEEDLSILVGYWLEEF